MNTFKTEIDKDGQIIVIETNKRILSHADINEEIQRIQYSKESLIMQSQMIAKEFQQLTDKEKYFQELLDNTKDMNNDNDIIILE